MTRTAEKLRTLVETPPWEWPENAGAVLLGVIRDRGAADDERVLAAGLAGDSVFIDDALAKALVAVMRSANEPDELRATAAIALGPVLEECSTNGFDDEWCEPPITARTFAEIQQAMRATYQDTAAPTLVRRRVLEGAVRAPSDWHADAVRAAHASDDPDWRLTGVFCMRFVRGFDEQILAELTNPDVQIQAEAIRAAGEWEIEAAGRHVLRILRSEKADKQLVLAAIEAVGAVSPDDALDVLTALEDSDDPEIAEAAEEASEMALARSGGDGDGFDDEDEDEEIF